MKRVVYGAALACVLVVVPVFHAAAFPLCAIYTPDDPQWYVFFCYLRVIR